MGLVKYFFLKLSDYLNIYHFQIYRLIILPKNLLPTVRKYSYSFLYSSTITIEVCKIRIRITSNIFSNFIMMFFTFEFSML